MRKLTLSLTTEEPGPRTSLVKGTRRPLLGITLFLLPPLRVVLDAVRITLVRPVTPSPL